MKVAAAGSDYVSAHEAYYGLVHRPFSLTPDLRFVYPSQSHSHAFEQVTEALKRREGLIVITGEIGTGKTVLCRTLLETFEPRTFLSVILDPCLTVSDLLQQVLTDFGLITRVEQGIRPPTADRHQLVSTLQRFLSTLASVGGHAVIMIDEAQHLDPAVLEEIRLLSNFDSDHAKLLQIVLAGQPDLDEALNRHDMRQLHQRVARRFELHPLSPTEVSEYIERRLFVAADGEGRCDGEPPAETVRFTPNALRAVARLSRGIPRMINTICDQALEIGFERQSRSIDRAVVVAAARRLKLRAGIAPSFPAATSLAVAAALFVAFLGAATWLWSKQTTEASAPQRLPAPVAEGATAQTPIRSAALRGEPASPIPTAGAVPAKPIAPPAAAQQREAGEKASGFEIAVAAFRTPQRAEEVADAIAQRGLPAGTRADPTGAWYRIVVGPLTSLDVAESVQRDLSRQGFAGTTISASGPVRR